MNTAIAVVVVLVALGAMYLLYKSVQKKNETPKEKPPKDDKPAGDEPKELP
jgi:threonine/homoserine/homoserine lactone efflux protein